MPRRTPARTPNKLSKRSRPTAVLLGGAPVAAAALALAPATMSCSAGWGTETATRDAAIDVRVRRSIVAASKHRGGSFETGQPELNIPHARVYVGSSDWGLYSINAASGQSVWRFQTLGPVQSRPLYDANEDTVYFGSDDGALYKVRAKDGRLLWRLDSNAEVTQKPVLADGIIYITNANDTLLALDSQTGAIQWHQHRAPSAGLEIAGYAGPLVWKDKVYTAFSTGIVSAFDANTGVERWQPVDLTAEAEQITGELPQYFDVDTTPVADEGSEGSVVYVASYAAGVYALDAETGALVWSNPDISGVTELTLWTGRGPSGGTRKLLYAASGTSGIWALDPEERGETVWHQALPEGGVSRPIPVSGVLMVSSTTYGLFLFSPLTGKVIDGLNNADGFTMTPAAYGTRAFVVSNEGFFYGLRVAVGPRG